MTIAGIYEKEKKMISKYMGNLADMKNKTRILEVVWEEGIYINFVDQTL